MSCRQTPNRYDWKRLFRSCLGQVLLIMSSLSLWGCFRASQVSDNIDGVAQSKIRPIEVNADLAARIGQEALDKIGYDQIIRLADKAGFVEQRVNVNVELASNGSVVAAGVARVFSRYAFAAALTSQADSPLPGPADIAAVGVLVIGLVDAGLLDGHLIKSIGKLIGAAGEATLPTTVTRDVPDDLSDCRHSSTVQTAHPGQWSPYEVCDRQYEKDRTACQRVCTAACWASAAERLAYCNRTKGVVGSPSLRT